MSQPSHKNPRSLMHRDVADLLKCLPDRKFAYRIFDAASGQVLRSVSSEDDAWSDDAGDDTMAPRSEPQPSLRGAAPGAGSTAPAVCDRDGTIQGKASSPAPGEAPAAAVAAVVPASGRADHGSAALGAIAAMITSGPQRRDQAAATRDTRSVLVDSKRRPQPWSSASASKPTVAQVWSRTIEGRGPREPRSAGQLLARVAGRGADVVVATPRSARSMTAAIVARGVATAAQAPAPARRPAPAGSAAALLRGVLRR